MSLAQFGLDGVFELVETGSPGGVVKAAALARVVRAWRVPPGEVIYVGDAISDMKVAHAAGVLPIAAAWASAAVAAELTAERPHALFTDAADFHAWLTASASMPGSQRVITSSAERPEDRLALDNPAPEFCGRMMMRPISLTAITRPTWCVDRIKAGVDGTRILSTRPPRRSSPISGPPPHLQAEVHPKRVLVVDDNYVAHDGAGALEVIRASAPDVVLCDIGLPGMSGYELARTVREESTSQVQLIAVSGYAQPGDVKKAIAAGFATCTSRSQPIPPRSSGCSRRAGACPPPYAVRWT
jgi:hypothetical protein